MLRCVIGKAPAHEGPSQMVDFIAMKSTKTYHGSLRVEWGWGVHSQEALKKKKKKVRANKRTRPDSIPGDSESLGLGRVSSIWIFPKAL